MNKKPNHWVDSLDGQTSEFITHYSVPSDKVVLTLWTALNIGDEVVLTRVVDDVPIGTVFKVVHKYPDQLLYEMELPDGLYKEFTSYVIWRYAVKLEDAVRRGLCS